MKQKTADCLYQVSELWYKMHCLKADILNSKLQIVSCKNKTCLGMIG